ncbi:class I SAM-dependent methyltransferase [Sedimenticola hydrogenitrophicus]|uniref:class I SAM-dependent methyltransferase n=1 Tax=Sedimenticola hydrogenitrophicus TaxID=2967975 RepID=UPI0021A717D2|nr:class I SAM-dependent methyltransferase [Sedimenticola hydrogenitrophicus]
MSTRIEFWNRMDNYEESIISLYHRPGTSQLLQRIAAIVTPETTAADIGCGHGYFLGELASAKRILAVDYAQNSIDQARTRAPRHTEFLLQHLAELALPEPVDLALCFSALMPENHTQALLMLERLTHSIKAGGTLLLVVPAMESLLYVINQVHYHEVRQGREKESISQRMSEFLSTFNNPLGYVRSSNGQVTKYWLAEEIVSQLQQAGRTMGLEQFKVPVTWRDYAAEADWQQAVQPPWFWGWQITCGVES